MFTPKVKSAPLTAPSIGTGERTAPAAVSRRGSIATGFTLIELMIVITIIGILAAIAVPSYQTALVKAREAVLREDLYSIRSAIDQFAADHGRYPLSLHELVEQRYLREVPVDPFTRSRETWIIQPPPAPPSLPGQAGADTAGAVPIQGNLYDLHSGSDLVGTNHVPYNEW